MIFKDHRYSIFGVAIWVGFVTAILLLYGFSTPLPLPAEKGILLEFEDSKLMGGGNINAGESGNKNNDGSNVSDYVPENGYNTQDNEEAPAMRPSTTPNTSEDPRPPTPSNKGQDKLGNKFWNFGSGSGTGNAGSGTGDGNPGLGTSGAGGGSGNAPSGSGKNLTGRAITYTPSIPSQDNLFGTAVCAITVDAKGNVISATIHISGGKEVDKIALEYVKQIKYAAIDGSDYQTGYYTVTLQQR